MTRSMKIVIFMDKPQWTFLLSTNGMEVVTMPSKLYSFWEWYDWVMQDTPFVSWLSTQESNVLGLDNNQQT